MVHICAERGRDEERGGSDGKIDLILDVWAGKLMMHPAARADLLYLLSQGEGLNQQCCGRLYEDSKEDLV